MIFEWNDETIARLKELHAQDFSFSHIAAVLCSEYRNGPTRNACIGKAQRLGLSKPPRPVFTKRTGNGKPRDAVVTHDLITIMRETAENHGTMNDAIKDYVRRFPDRPEPAYGTVRSQASKYGIRFRSIAAPMPSMKAKLILDGHTPLALAPIEQPVEALFRPRSKGVTLLQLEQRMCKWPLGDVRSESFRYCGETKIEGKSYCLHHFKASCSAAWLASQSGRQFMRSVTASFAQAAE